MSEWRRALRPWCRDATAAVIVALAAVSFYLSTAGLLFQGPLADHRPEALGAALLGGAVLAFGVAWRGSLPIASAGAVPAVVPVLAALCASTAQDAAARAGAAAVLPTVVIALTLMTLAVGAVWSWMGRSDAGRFIRYIPYPVIGGFMGATGWLMVTGGLAVAAGAPLSVSGLMAGLEPLHDPKLLTGLACGIVMWGVGRRVSHPLALPLMLVIGAVGIHTGLTAAAIETDGARQSGWLQAAFAQARPIWPWTPELLGAVDWGALLMQSGWIVSGVIVATLSLLLTTSSLEFAWGVRADLNRELRAYGGSNLIAAAAGGLVGGASLSRSALNRAAGAQGPASGLILGVLCLLAMEWGGPVIAWVPLPLLGGLLVAQGLEMLKSWLVDAPRRLSHRDGLTVCGMVLVTALFGFLPAVCLGVLACCVGFAVSQSQLSPVRRHLSRAEWVSNVERSADQTEWLTRRGAALHIVELQGVLFFGSSLQLSQRLQGLLDDLRKPRCLLLDFSAVTLVDSSGAQALSRVFADAQRFDVAVELSALQPAHRAALEAVGAFTRVSEHRHASVDAAVAAWDEAQLAAAHDATPGPEALAAGLQKAVGAAVAERLLAAFDRLSLAPQDVLFERDAPSEALYLVATGRLAVVVPSGDGVALRTVRTVLPGGTVGEMGLFRQQPRTATVKALEPTDVLRLSRDRLQALQEQDAEAAAALYRMFVQQMAGRVDQLTRQVYALRA